MNLKTTCSLVAIATASASMPQQTCPDPHRLAKTPKFCRDNPNWLAQAPTYTGPLDPGFFDHNVSFSIEEVDLGQKITLHIQ